MIEQKQKDIQNQINAEKEKYQKNIEDEKGFDSKIVY